MEQDDFVVVVPPTSPEEADQQYEAWLSERPDLRAILTGGWQLEQGFVGRAGNSKVR
jgi:hypothetical protein